MDLSKLSLEELHSIRKVIESQELQMELYRMIEIKEAERLIPTEYQSDRLPEFYSQYEEKCLDLLAQLNYRDVEFFQSCALRDAGNNKGGDFYSSNHGIYQTGYHSLVMFEEFFKDQRNIYLYEGAFNTLNYMKASICTTLNSGKNISSKKDLFEDYSEKEELIENSLGEIATGLLRVRMLVPNSRLSVANQGLTKTSRKVVGSQITYHQRHFIQALAFGNSLEDLKSKNYEGAKRLLYVPREK